ncbi:MAG: 30S ribosomal protein S5 [Candidatus Magasanikbacteria bacterium]|nr:30S ribosomal protein S5 [Candidatus Magasanikbacteria bacterium]
MEENKKQFKGTNKGERRGRSDKPFEEKEFDSVILDLARVTRVTKGGKRMRFRAAVVIGDRKGKVGFGIAKGADVALAVSKATRLAKKTLFKIALSKTTIPHWVALKEHSAQILLKPAPAGSGIIAGGAMRVVLELGGVPDVVGKMLGGNNKVNNARATIKALKSLKLRTVSKK